MPIARAEQPIKRIWAAARSNASIGTTVFLGGITAGFWIGYALLIPLSWVPLPSTTLGLIALLGPYLDYFAESMLQRVLAVLGAAVIAYLTAYGVYTAPALLGWLGDPLARQALFLAGLKQTFIYWAGGTVLLIASTFTSFIARQTYAELAR